MNKDELAILNSILKLVAKLIADTDAINDFAQHKRKVFSLVEAKKKLMLRIQIFRPMKLFKENLNKWNMHIHNLNSEMMGDTIFA